MNLREPGGAGRRLALVMTAAALALSTTACRVQLSAPHAATAPRADGGLEDWDSVPRRLVAVIRAAWAEDRAALKAEVLAAAWAAVRVVVQASGQRNPPATGSS